MISPNHLGTVRQPTASQPLSMQSPQNSLPMQLLRAREVFMQRLRPHFRAHELTEQQWRVIRVLSEVNVMDMQGLARCCCIHPPSLSRIIPKLSARGIVLRLPGENDHRRVSVQLTTAGRTMVAAVGTDVWGSYAGMLKDIGPERIAAVTVALANLIEAMGGEAIVPTGEDG